MKTIGYAIIAILAIILTDVAGQKIGIHGPALAVLMTAAMIGSWFISYVLLDHKEWQKTRNR